MRHLCSLPSCKNKVKGDSFSGEISMPGGAWRVAAACHFCCLCTLLCRGVKKKKCQKLNLEKSAWEVQTLQVYCSEGWKKTLKPHLFYVCCSLFILGMVMRTCSYSRRLKSITSVNMFVARLASAESSTFKSKHALAFSHAAIEDKLSLYFQC